MENELERYLDFSTDERDLLAFRAGTDTHPKLAQFAVEIQRYIETRNPVCAIRGLIALHAATTAGYSIGATKSRTITNVWLSVVAALLAYIAYQLS